MKAKEVYNTKLLSVNKLRMKEMTLHLILSILSTKKISTPHIFFLFSYNIEPINMLYNEKMVLKMFQKCSCLWQYEFFTGPIVILAP